MSETPIRPQPTSQAPAGSQHAEPGRHDRLLLLLLAAIPLALHLASLLTPGYGYFIDEFYYLACAKRLALGYVDHPPLAPALLALTRPVLGESLLGIRLVPYLAASATVWVAGRIVVRLGGGRFAIVLAAVAVGLAPSLLAMSGFFSMNAFEPLIWSLVVLSTIRLVQTGDARRWVVVGLLIGLGFENKHTILMYVAALGAGLVMTPARKLLASRWMLAGAALAAVVALPNLVWQVANGFPSLEFYRAAHLEKNVPSPPLRTLATLAVVLNPLTLPLWLAGGAWLAAARDWRPYRYLAVMAAVVLVLHVASQSSRPDRAAAVFPMLLAAGAVVAERRVRRRPARAAVVAALLLGAAPIVPLAIPLLPPPVLAPYAAAAGATASAERGKTSPIPQILADRTGWESFVDDVARAASTLTPDERRRAIVYAPSYGQAGALELLGPARGLPRVICGHNTYWHWSAGRTNTEVLIAVDASPERLRTLFRDVREVGRVRCSYCMSWRADLPVLVARGSLAPVESIWPEVRHYE